MFTVGEEKALARQIFQAKNHGHVNLDGSTVPHPSKDPTGHEAVSKALCDRFVVGFKDLPVAQAEFTRLAKEAGLSFEGAFHWYRAR